MHVDAWQGDWFGNPLSAWLLAAIGAVAGFVVVYGIAMLLGRRLAHRAVQYPGGAAETFASALKATRGWILLLLAVLIASGFLELPHALRLRLGQLAYVLVGVQLALWVSRLVESWLQHAAGRQRGTRRNPVLIGILSWSAQAVIWIVLLLAVLDNAGVNVNTLVASLGVGGVAVALAAQNVLGDLFASLSIGLDKPFDVGDDIAFGEVSGVVRHVGIKSTRILSQSGEEVVVANSVLLKEQVRNYSRLRERRVTFRFGIANDTPRASVERLLDDLRRAIEGLPEVRLDRGHFIGFGQYSLDFEFVYLVLNPRFAHYRDIQQAINLCVLELLERMQVKLAVPVRLLRDERARNGEGAD